jgi:hypothetical protein
VPAGHPVRSGSIGLLQREAAVRELFGFEQLQRIGAAWVAEPAQLGHHLQGEQHVVELDGEVDPIRAAAPPRRDEGAVALSPQQPSVQHQVSDPLRGVQRRLVAVCLAERPEATRRYQ